LRDINDSVGDLKIGSSRAYDVVTTMPAKKTQSTSIDLLHRRYGHVNKRNLQRIASEIGIKLTGELSHCEGCVFGKQTRQPRHEPASQRAERLGELLHIDPDGPWKTPTLRAPRNGKFNAIPPRSKYFLLITDDYTSYKWVYFYEKKSDFGPRIIELTQDLKADGTPVRRIRCDQATEFLSGEVLTYLSTERIEFEPSATYAHEQNGKSERGNRSVIEKAKCLMYDLGLPDAF
jgi:hypothetical protein